MGHLNALAEEFVSGGGFKSGVGSLAGLRRQVTLAYALHEFGRSDPVAQPILTELVVIFNVPKTDIVPQP